MNCGGPPGGTGTCGCDPFGSCPWRNTDGVAEWLADRDKMTDAEREGAFLKAYEALCYRWGIIVTSCGCCDSPWLVVDPDKADCFGCKTDIGDHVKKLKNVKDT